MDHAHVASQARRSSRLQGPPFTVAGHKRKISYAVDPMEPASKRLRNDDIQPLAHPTTASATVIPLLDAFDPAQPKPSSSHHDVSSEKAANPSCQVSEFKCLSHDLASESCLRLLDTLLYTTGQIPFPLCRLPKMKLGPKASHRRDQLISSIDILTDDFPSTFKKLSEAFRGCRRNPADTQQTSTASVDLVFFLTGHSLASLHRTRVFVRLEDLVIDDPTLRNSSSAQPTTKRRPRHPIKGLPAASFIRDRSLWPNVTATANALFKSLLPMGADPPIGKAHILLKAPRHFRHTSWRPQQAQSRNLNGKVQSLFESTPSRPDGTKTPGGSSCDYAITVDAPLFSSRTREGLPERVLGVPKEDSQGGRSEDDDDFKEEGEDGDEVEGGDGLIWWQWHGGPLQGFSLD